MPTYFDGTEVDDVTMDGTALDSLIIDGTEVFTLPPVTVVNSVKGLIRENSSDTVYLPGIGTDKKWILVDGSYSDRNELVYYDDPLNPYGWISLIYPGISIYEGEASGSYVRAGTTFDSGLAAVAVDASIDKPVYVVANISNGQYDHTGDYKTSTTFQEGASLTGITIDVGDLLLVCSGSRRTQNYASSIPGFTLEEAMVWDVDDQAVIFSQVVTESTDLNVTISVTGYFGGSYDFTNIFLLVAKVI